MSTFQIIEGNIGGPIGFQATGIHCGLKREKLDLGIIISQVPATAAAVYTTNLFQAAPLKVNQESIKKAGKLQAIVVNSGNANACTGEKGMDDAYTMQRLVQETFNIEAAHFVGVASTGVIGEYLPMEKISNGIHALPGALNEESGALFSKAIMTTDLVQKTVCVQLTMDGKTVTISGTAKGSGMIHPNMATMLGFVTTDANIQAEYLQSLLGAATNETFNMITVDGDTSTNDMVLVMANGMAGNETLQADHPQANEFYTAFSYVLEQLAKKIARDGEGATKLLEVEVKNAPSIEIARQVAKSVIGSNLVKTAIYGADANWGRILCAVGYSGAAINPNVVDVYLGEIQVVKGSFPAVYSEEEATEYLKGENIHVVVDLNDGTATARGWGCDLTYDYVKINASYRS
jgi:glutamate N-acetyltransferase / amino-acid N-acetyltransferase